MKVFIALLLLGAIVAFSEGQEIEQAKCRNPAYCDIPCYLVPASPCPRCYCPAPYCQDIGRCEAPCSIDYCGPCPVCSCPGNNGNTCNLNCPPPCVGNDQNGQCSCICGGSG
ncbi:hypothetical protein NPIL_327891 [Nephila pilipes]|uniref:Spider venom protein n=1 Tax=Nephila pilipes TaxID=299642 RepID=A0A8X6UUP1_NEPPI|nr:hypothetical protein NPIL_327891 [Nephila pilipes]